jgi:L-asparaginase
MKKILLIQTGGTIDKDYPRSRLGYAFEIGEAAVRRILEKANPGIDYEILPLLRKDSTEITEEDRRTLLNTCKTADAAGILITHGTDTMIETAVFLSAINDKVIVLTGAMRPQKFSDTDADFNVGFALGALQTAKPGVYVAMNACLIPADQAMRDPETGRFMMRI